MLSGSSPPTSNCWWLLSLVAMRVGVGPVAIFEGAVISRPAELMVVVAVVAVAARGQSSRLVPRKVLVTTVFSAGAVAVAVYSISIMNNTVLLLLTCPGSAGFAG